MAYTIISQNNTTTTLADENGNVIHVPAKTVLATSTSYTITKVNNNSADLEDENGKIIRGVPCVVVLAGDGGGGGDSVDYAKTVQRAETMPTADSSNAGQQFLYSGATDATYTHGYIYENVATTTSSSASAEQTVGSTLSDIAVDLATLESFTGWTTDNSLQIFYTADGWSVDATSLGVTYTGTPNVGDAITITYTAGSTSYAWTRIDVQPAGGATYTAGTGINISGNVISVQYPTIVTNTTGTNINGAGAYVQTVVVGGTVGGEQAVAIGDASRAVQGGTAIGFNAKATGTVGPIAIGNGTSGGWASISVGYGASIRGDQSVGIGPWATTGSSAKRSTALGANAVANAYGAIQIGYGTNAEAGTMYVALSTDDNTHPNYKLLDTDGTIPSARLADTTSAQQGDVLTFDSTGNAVWQAAGGTIQYTALPTASADELGNIYQFVGTTDATYTNGYFYKCVSDGQTPATYSWEEVEVQASSGGSTYTAGTGISIDANNEISVAKPVLVNKSSNFYGLLITNKTNSTQTGPGTAIGYGAVITGDFGGGIAIGANGASGTTSAAGGGIAIGRTCSASSNAVSIAIGSSIATTAQRAIIIGCAPSGVSIATNSDADTFKVSNGNGIFEIMSADGTIPAARHASLPASDGTYVLKLVISGGVPTLSWVAE